MSKQNDGGPAFPVANGPDTGWAEGMTLRDYFAAKAMAALIAEPMWCEGQTPAVDRVGGTKGTLSENYASAAYKMADAMLAAREAK